MANSCSPRTTERALSGALAAAAVRLDMLRVRRGDAARLAAGAEVAVVVVAGADMTRRLSAKLVFRTLCSTRFGCDCTRRVQASRGRCSAESLGTSGHVYLWRVLWRDGCRVEAMSLARRFECVCCGSRGAARSARHVASRRLNRMLATRCVSNTHGECRKSEHRVVTFVVPVSSVNLVSHISVHRLVVR